MKKTKYLCFKCKYIQSLKEEYYKALIIALNIIFGILESNYLILLSALKRLYIFGLFFCL